MMSRLPLHTALKINSTHHAVAELSPIRAVRSRGGASSLRRGFVARCSADLVRASGVQGYPDEYGCEPGQFPRRRVDSRSRFCAPVGSPHFLAPSAPGRPHSGVTAGLLVLNSSTLPWSGCTTAAGRHGSRYRRGDCQRLLTPGTAGHPGSPAACHNEGRHPRTDPRAGCRPWATRHSGQRRPTRIH
jgi:hypothetical protein